MSRKKNNLYYAFGESKTLKNWSKDPRCKVKYTTLVKRTADYKWPLERALVETCHDYGRADLVGKKYGRLLVVKLHGISKQKQTVWECECECGNKKIVRIGTLISQHTRSCGCLKKDIMTEQCKRLFSLPEGEASLNLAYSRYKLGAKRRGLSWGITKKDFIKYILSECFYCGEKPNNYTQYNTYQNGTTPRNGIDRIDSNIGYELDNCVPSCSFCNYAKRSLTQPQFLLKIKQISKKWEKN